MFPKEKSESKSTHAFQLCSLSSVSVTSDAEHRRRVPQPSKSFPSPVQQGSLEISHGSRMGYPYLKICSKLDFFFPGANN